MSNSKMEAEIRALQMRQTVQGLALEELMRLIPPDAIAASLARLSLRLDEEVRKRGRSLGTQEDEAMTTEFVRILGATVVTPASAPSSGLASDPRSR